MGVCVETANIIHYQVSFGERSHLRNHFFFCKRTPNCSRCPLLDLLKTNFLCEKKIINQCAKIALMNCKHFPYYFAQATDCHYNTHTTPLHIHTQWWFKWLIDACFHIHMKTLLHFHSEDEVKMINRSLSSILWERWLSHPSWVSRLLIYIRIWCDFYMLSLSHSHTCKSACG